MIRTLYIFIAIMGYISNNQLQAAEYFIHPQGKNSNDGSIETPFFHIQVAVDRANPGDIIWVRGGLYYYDTRITLKQRSGTADEPIRIFSWQDEKPILDFSALPVGSSSQGIRIEANHWYIKRLEVRKSGDAGFKITGNHNFLEQCVSHHNHGGGFQLGFSHGEMNNEEGERCAYNTLLNCDAIFNFDYSTANGTTPGTNADGFSCKMRGGKGNRFIGCRAWRNSDDGWDLFESGFAVLIENCWTWSNGEYNDFTDTYFEKYGKELTESLFSGDGNGFKIGGNHATVGTTCTNESRGTHIVRNCISFGHYKSGANGHKGFDQNSHRDGAYFENCLAFANNENFRFWAEPNPGKHFWFTNCISFDTRGRGDLFINGSTHTSNSWNLSLMAAYDQFLSLSEEAASAPRMNDGSLPDKFGRLADGSMFIDKGTPISAITVDGLSVGSIPFYGTKPDLGAYEVVFTGVNKEKGTKSHGTMIFPNPANPNNKISIKTEVTGKVLISLYSLSGRKVLHHGPIDVKSFNQEIFLHHSVNTPGIYLLEVSSNGKRSVNKVVIL